MLGTSRRKKEQALSRETHVSPSSAPVLSCAHYFQEAATQAIVSPTKRTSVKFRNFGELCQFSTNRFKKLYNFANFKELFSIPAELTDFP